MDYIEEHKGAYFSERGNKVPEIIVVHATGGSFQGDLRTLKGLTGRQVSCHYYIDRTGKIYYMVNEHKSAWHAGLSKWKNLEVLKWGGWSVNDVSIGIELENDGAEEYTDLQYESLIYLIRDIRTRWNIPKENIVGHRDVSPDRKIDPYDHFNWRRVREGVFRENPNGLEGTYPEWANEGVYWAKKNNIITKITGEPLTDWRMALILFKFYKFILKILITEIKKRK